MKSRIFLNIILIVTTLLIFTHLCFNFSEYDTRTKKFNSLKNKIFSHQGLNLDKDGNSLIGRKMRSFELIDQNKMKVKFGEVKAKLKILIIFNVYDCYSCLLEYRLWKNIYTRYNKSDVFITGICINESFSTLNHWVKEKGIKFPVLHDPDSIVKSKMGFGRTPIRIMLNNDDQIIDIQQPKDSLANSQEVFAKIDKILAKKTIERTK